MAHHSGAPLIFEDVCGIGLWLIVILFADLLWCVLLQ